MTFTNKTNKLKLILMIFILLVAIIASANMVKLQAYNLPDLGSSTDRSFPIADEKLFGEYIFHDIQHQLPIIQNPFLDNYIQNLGDELLSHSNSHFDNFKFFIINSSIINAFALPGGYIGVNKGLILAADSENEVAAVLAHEITHVNQRHIARSFEQQKQMQLPMLAGIIAGALLSAYSPELGQSIIAGSMAAGNQSLINYTREHEAEADRVGIYTLAASGYPPSSMAEFFNKLNKYSYSDNDFFPEYLRTHPVTENRIADTTNRADKIKFKPKKSNSIDFLLVKNMLTIASNPNLVKAIDDNLSASKNKTHTQQQQNIFKFNAAFALLKHSEYTKAKSLLLELNKTYQKNDIIASLLAESHKNQPQKALDILDQQLKISKKPIPLSIQYAKIALNNKFKDNSKAPANKAMTELKKISKKQEHYNPEVDLLLAEAYNKMGKKWHASLAYANFAVKKGDLETAIMQLKATSKFDKLTSYQRKITDYRIKELENKNKSRKEKLKKII